MKIAVATHKAYQMPQSDIYLPVQSGAELQKEDLGYAKDNTGDNISIKNKNYSELTAIYWLWKNVQSDYKGVAHYRRHFSKKQTLFFTKGEFQDVIEQQELEALLQDVDIILPKLRHYYIETLASHYKHTHFEQDLTVTEKVIEQLYPEYLTSYHEVLQRKSGHMFNMFIMKDDYFDQYCEWLFSILFELEKQLDISDYNPFHARVFGRVSELLLDVWITKNQIRYKEVPVIFMEEQNWYLKCKKFLQAKLLNKKY
ncbi:MAG: DUF4422 domain-containing protein [Enterococcus sp.]